jgi:hypothetical protein
MITPATSTTITDADAKNDFLFHIEKNASGPGVGKKFPPAQAAIILRTMSGQLVNLIRLGDEIDPASPARRQTHVRPPCR